MSRSTDEELIRRLQDGHEDALDQLYARYAGLLFAYCLNFTRCRNPQDSEDLVQDVFLRIVNAAHRFNPRKASFRTWMFRIARNHCIDVIRHQKNLRWKEDSLTDSTIRDPGWSVESALAWKSILKAVRDCITELENDDEREALLLYYLGGKVLREVGEVLGKSISMARNRLNLATQKVKRCLQRKGVTELPVGQCKDSGHGRI